MFLLIGMFLGLFVMGCNNILLNQVRFLATDQHLETIKPSLCKLTNRSFDMHDIIIIMSIIYTRCTYVHQQKKCVGGVYIHVDSL